LFLQNRKNIVDFFENRIKNNTFKKEYVKEWIETKVHSSELPKGQNERKNYDYKQNIQSLWKVNDPRKSPPLTTKINIPTGGKNLKGILPPKSYNDDYPVDFPHLIDTSIVYPFYNSSDSPDQGNMITYLFVDFLKKHIPMRKPPLNVEFRNIPKIDNILFKENQNSWSNNNLLMDPNAEWKFYLYPSKISFIIPILENFMNLLQKITNYYENKPFPTILQKWSSLRYAIKSLEISPNYLLKMEYYIEIIRQYSFYTLLFYVEIFTNDKNEIIYSIIECLGTSPTEKSLMLDNGEITNTFVHPNPDGIYTNLNKYFSNEEKVIPHYEKTKILEDRKKNNFKNSYACFDTNPETNNSSLIITYSKDLCESPYDFYGKPKPQGLYDHPCQEDIECPFYEMNKNYKNGFGGCNKKTGYCQLPIGVKPLGFRYYQSKSKPLCYNCDASKWNANSILDNCCEEQNSLKKYSFLNSSDYAFEGDKLERSNQSIEKYFK